MFRRILQISAAAGALVVPSAYWFLRHEQRPGNFQDLPELPPVPSREQMLAKLTPIAATAKKAAVSAEGESRNQFDLIVIGGGSTGTGAALDGATRGLRVLLVERDDFASGSSSKSTKLVHGGVRYLEQAVKNLDIGQYKLVHEALHERSTFLHVAPYLARELAIMTPLYSWIEVPYMWVGLKMYDWISGGASFGRSHFMSAEDSLQRFPALQPQGLKGSVVYFDGQFNDARMNVALAMTAAAYGAVTLNHCEVVRLTFDGEGQVSGVVFRDRQSNQEYEARGLAVVNATGPYSNYIRRLDAPGVEGNKAYDPRTFRGSSGVHIVLKPEFAPRDMGLLIPKTEDGRVLFVLPWLGFTVAGTTDKDSPLQDNPVPLQEDVKYILHHLQRYLAHAPTESDVLSAWAGIRPLAHMPAKGDAGVPLNTAQMSRDHAIDASETGLISITGGKWTTYRRMAEDVVDVAVREVYAKKKKLETTMAVNAPPAARTHEVRVYGSHKYTGDDHVASLQSRFGLSAAVASHLAHSYGDRAEQVLAVAKELKPTTEQPFGKRLIPSLPILEAEVLHAARVEQARTPLDVLCRRTRAAFLDRQGAIAAVPRVVQLMAAELKWDKKRQTREVDAAIQYLQRMTGLADAAGSSSSSN